MRVSNIMDRTASVVSCIDKGKGLLVTTSEASFRTGQTVTYTNEELYTRMLFISMSASELSMVISCGVS